MIPRSLEPQLKKAAKEFGVVSVTGPRQSGKTTLVRSVFSDYKYVNFENLADLQAIKSDPASFIKGVKNGVVIDEVQRFPEILSFIQLAIDDNFKPGKFILTGSQNLLLLEKVGQSLAGRVAVLTLFPLSIFELKSKKLLDSNYQKQILNGFFPGLYDKEQSIDLFYSSYITTYVERDVRNIKNIGDLTNFQRFLQLLAGRVGQLINFSQLGNDVGVTHKTIESWLSVLEASYLIIKLQPFYKNFGKRIVKSSKVYFTDTGLASYLLGIDNQTEMSRHFALGPLFENLIISDLYKQKLNNISSSKLFFFRDNTGNEVDVVIDKGSEILAIELKSTSTYSSNLKKGLDFFGDLADERVRLKKILVYTGEHEQKIKDVSLTNWKSITKVKV